MIHATADFEFMRLMRLHPEAVAAGVRALRGGCPVLVDVKMIAAGLNEERLRAYGCAVHSYISDEDVIADRPGRQLDPRHRGHAQGPPAGHAGRRGGGDRQRPHRPARAGAPGARGGRAARAGHRRAGGVRVGRRVQGGGPRACRSRTIVARGRKGGSPIAVAIIHALLLLSTRGEPP